MLLYWLKKRKAVSDDKVVKYAKRKKVADKKLRVNGKFVSKKQAITMLGMTKKDFSKAIKAQAKQHMDGKLAKNKQIDAQVTWDADTRKGLKLSNA